MIDFFHVVLDVKHPPFGAKYFYVPEETGVIGDGKRNKKYIRFADGVSDIEAKSLEGGSKISIRTSPLSPFQGHNVVGSSDVWTLIFNTIMCVLDALMKVGVIPLEKEVAAIGAGKFELLELDITERIAIDEHSAILKILHHLLSSLPLENRAGWKEKGIAISFINPKTKVRHTLYDKLSEITDRRTITEGRLKCMFENNVKYQHEAHELLRDLAKGSIRYEQKYSAETLKALGLNNGIVWKKDSTSGLECLASRCFKEELKGIPYSSYSPMEEKTIFSMLEEGKAWKDASLIALWMQGGQPKKMGMDRKTFDTAVIRIRTRYKLDITTPYVRRENKEISMAEVFSEKNIVSGKFKPPKHLARLSSDGSDLAEKAKKKWHAALAISKFKMPSIKR